MSVIRRLRSGAVRAVYSAYYTARDLNYAYGLPTTNSGGGTRFETYELYSLHGRDRLLRELIRRTDPGEVVYDLGANVGVYTCAAASVEAETVAFEPNPKAREKLRMNLRANGFDSTVLPFAVSDENATDTLHVSSYPETTSLSSRHATVSGGSVVESVEVQKRTLDSLAGRLPAPDHVKIDVEGEGGAVLRGSEGLLQTERPTVYFETHSKTEDARGTLREAGYSVEEVGDGWVCKPP